MSPYLANALFEGIGSVLIWLNVRTLLRDRCVRGTRWGPPIFFATWGYWNLFYYPALHPWWSAAGGASLALANTVWVLLAWHYRRVVNAPEPQSAPVAGTVGSWSPANEGVGFLGD